MKKEIEEFFFSRIRKRRFNFREKNQQKIHPQFRLEVNNENSSAKRKENKKVGESESLR